ncbi:hypothetical protein G6F58_005659 [Rhizopus delemar]|nr:hypothetical protein G6F58_005659 [Rhizopus delemar]
MNITNLKALTRKDLRRQAGNKPILEESIDVQSLPEEILDDLKTTPKSVLRAKLKKFAKDASKYEEGKSRSPVHTSGRATAEIYQEFQHVIENGGTEADMSNILERIQQTRSEESVIRRATQQKCNGFNKGGNTHRGFGRRGCANGNKEILLFREGEEDTGLLVVPRTISVVSASVFNMFKPLSFLYLSKPRTVEQIMNDINENDTANRYLTTGEAFELFKRLQIEERAQRDGNLHDSDLSLGISEYLDGTLMYELKEKSKRFKRQVARYNNGAWNRQE